MRNGVFVTFEGIDGCGKTTQLTLAHEALLKKGVPCMVTREPGGTAIGEKIRDIILSPEHGEMNDRCELFLYMAARAQHAAETIVPCVKKGMVALCDRFADATFAYQGHGRGIPIDILEKMNSYAVDSVQPTFTFLFDISVETSKRRLAQAGKTADRLEGSGAEFYERVRKGYLALAKQFPHRIMVLSGDRAAPDLSAVVCAKILELYRL